VPVRPRGAVRRAVDAAFRVALRGAYLGARVWWRLRRAPHEGALAALWCDGRIVLVRTSYRRGVWSLPGGGVRRGEDGALAAARECREEIGIALDPAALRLAFTYSDRWEGRPDTVRVYEAHFAAEPALAIDHREIVAAELVARDAALARRLPPHLRAYLEQRR